MLTCRELVALVTEYLDGKLPFSRRLAFQFHVGLCGNCRRYLRQMKQTVSTLQELPAEEAIPPDVRDELLTRFRTWKQSPPT